MFCSNCGIKNKDTANFCFKCGYDLQEDINQDKDNTSLRQVSSKVHDDAILSEKIGKIPKIIFWGGGSGARWAAKQLSSTSYEMSCEVASKPELVRKIISYIFENNNARIINSDESLDTIEIKATMSSGFLNANPAVVNVLIKQEAPDKTKISIQASAKEGLIKQKTAEKAVRLIVKQLLD